MPLIRYYLSFFLQIYGLCTVAICFIQGIKLGDYGRIELFQFISGILIFYVGSYIKKWGRRMICLGIDPGSLKMGYGVVECAKRSLKYIDSGTLTFNKKKILI